MTAYEIRLNLKRFSDEARSLHAKSFFKTYAGGYGAGDKFWGLTVPYLRKLAKQYGNISLAEIIKLLQSDYHEERFIALVVLIKQYNKGDRQEKQVIHSLYLDNLNYVNNWDLVDLSAEVLIGEYLYEFHRQDKSLLMKLAKSTSLWERRVAILSTFAFIKHNEPDKTLEIAKVLLNDDYDLIQKAVGWMLREVGKRVSEQDEKAFLAKHYKNMPRTALRYAIERFPEEERRKYLLGQI